MPKYQETKIQEIWTRTSNFKQIFLYSFVSSDF